MPVRPYWDQGRLMWVDVLLPDGRRRRLQGMDRYWVAWPDYGAFNVDIWQYQGRQAVSYLWAGVEVDTGGVAPPEDAVIWTGEWTSDERARELGLL